jgi:deoxyribonuclease-4
VGRIRVGPARVPSRETPEAAVELLVERGYDACEIDFESGFWMDYPWAERFGELAREHGVALSVHAPLFGWVGHLEASGRKWSSALGALDRSAGIAAASGAEVVVFHPGFLLGRAREDSIDAVVEQLALVRERLEGKDRAVPFGIEVMDGTLRADPLREALAGFERPATVISESPDEASSQAIRAVLTGGVRL